MSEWPKFHHIYHEKNTNLVSKKGKIGGHREAQHLFLGAREKRCPYVTTAAAQQQHSSSAAAAQQQRSSSTAAAQQQQKQQSRCSRGGGGGDGGEGGVGGGNTASLFWHGCRSITMVHQKERRGHIKNMVDTSSPRLMSKLILVVRTYRLASPVRGPAAAAAAVPLLASACVPKNTKRETICCDGLCSAMHRGS